MTNQGGATPAASLAPADMGTRVIAYIIDAVILSIAYLILIAALPLPGGAIVRSIIFAALSFLYFGYSWRTWRASPGQRVLTRMTVNATDGSTLTWNQSVMRFARLFGPSVVGSLFGNADQVGGTLSFILSLVVLGYYIYLFWTASQDPKRQGLHDKQSGSIVIKGAAASTV
jgi:uncharacterized RDD family membrane protein YckC